MATAPQTNDPPNPKSGLLTPDTTAVEGEWTPDTVLSTLAYPPTQNSPSPVPFFHLLERLKTTKREGWRRFKIDHGESISDHMYRMSIMTMLAPSSLASRLDIPRCTKMALIHDMAESLVGDITPVDGVPKAEKSRREEATMDYLSRALLGRVDGGAAGGDIKAVWIEYEEGKTLEARFVHDVDKIELLLQMVDYERSGEGKVDLEEFAYVAQKVDLPETKVWAQELLKERAEFWDGLKGMKKENNDIALAEKKMAMSDEYYARD